MVEDIKEDGLESCLEPKFVKDACEFSSAWVRRGPKGVARSTGTSREMERKGSSAVSWSGGWNSIFPPSLHRLIHAEPPAL